MAMDIPAAMAMFVASDAPGIVVLAIGVADPTVGRSATDKAIRRAIMVPTTRIVPISQDIGPAGVAVKFSWQQ